jgi:hypothetical protein
MWAGPYNPMGSYNFPTHYGDGTPVYEDDFSTDEWPATESGDGERWIYGELDLNKMVPPSVSCMGAKLPPNNVVRGMQTKSLSRYPNKPVVCTGKNE